MAKWSDKEMADFAKETPQRGSVAYDMDTERLKKSIQDIIDDNKNQIPVEDRQEELHGDPADHKWVHFLEDDACANCGDPICDCWLDADNWHSVNVMEGYYPLFCVLNDALNEAQSGKGEARHGNGLSFTEQPALTITRAVGLGFPLGQAMKKIQESQRMDTDAAKRELLGAINYLASAILYLEK